LPEIVATVELATADVVTLKVAVVAFAATVTLAGTCAAALLLERVTTAPPEGAGAVRVTVPVEELPPTRAVGFRTTDISEEEAGVTFRVALRVTFSDVPKIVTTVVEATFEVVTVKFAVKLPTGTVTLAGTAATAGLLLESGTRAPPVGAAPLRVTVPVDGFPPTRSLGFRITDSIKTGAGVTVKAND